MTRETFYQVGRNSNLSQSRFYPRLVFVCVLCMQVHMHEHVFMW